jgi:hypothetical protein
MGPSKCAKPAAASEAVNGLRDSKSLASDGNLAQKPHRAQVVTAARNAPPARRQLPAWQYIAAEPRRATYAAVDLMVAELPYGFWKDATGRIVVFNRGYLPIWQRFLNGEIQPANPHEWSAGSKNDGSTPTASVLKKPRANACAKSSGSFSQARIWRGSRRTMFVGEICKRAGRTPGRTKGESKMTMNNHEDILELAHKLAGLKLEGLTTQQIGEAIGGVVGHLPPDVSTRVVWAAQKLLRESAAQVSRHADALEATKE